MFDGHQQKAPTPAKKFGCNLCNKSFRLEEGLKNHVNAVHQFGKSIVEKPLTIEEKRRLEAQLSNFERYASINLIYKEINGMSTETLKSACQSLHLDYHNKSPADLAEALRLHYKTERNRPGFQPGVLNLAGERSQNDSNNRGIQISHQNWFCKEFDDF